MWTKFFTQHHLEIEDKKGEKDDKRETPKTINNSKMSGIIASVLTGERKTQREIAEIAQVTEVTIRNRYKELVECLQFIIYI